MGDNQIDSRSKSFHKGKEVFDPEGKPEDGIHEDILQIKLAKEAKRWDVMVVRLNQHLDNTKQDRDSLKKQTKKDQELLEQAKEQEQMNQGGKDKKQTQKQLAEQQQKQKLEQPINHIDQNGIKYKQAYKKDQSQGDENFGQAELKKMFDGMTYYPVFSKEEIDLIACAYKSQLKEIRHAIKTIDLLETKSKFDTKKQCMEKYRNGLIYNLCCKGKQQIENLEDYCVKAAAHPLTLILFLKMQADIYRYMAEQTQKYNDDVDYRNILTKISLEEKVKKMRDENNFDQEDWEKMESKDFRDKYFKEERLKQIYKGEAWKHYKKAKFIGRALADKIALSDSKELNQLKQINSIQLGLGLNYAVFLWEIVGDPVNQKLALRHLKRLQQRALDDFDHWKDDEREKISQQVELIKENINQWTEAGITTDSDEEN